VAIRAWQSSYKTPCVILSPSVEGSLPLSVADGKNLGVGQWTTIALAFSTVHPDLSPSLPRELVEGRDVAIRN